MQSDQLSLSPRPHRVVTLLLGVMALMLASAAWASDECKPHSLFTPMQGYHPIECDAVDFGAYAFPVGLRDDHDAELKIIEGRYETVAYAVDEGATPSSPLKILRNHLTAAQAKGATVIWEPGNASFMAGEWGNIQQQIATLRMTQGGKEYWVHLGSVNEGDYYAIASVMVEPMVQEVSVNTAPVGPPSTSNNEHCKPHPLFTVMRGYVASQCAGSEFDAREIPIGLTGDGEAKMKTIEGRYDLVEYTLEEGRNRSSALKILRNHLAAAKQQGATVVWEPGELGFHPSEWGSIQQHIATLRMTQGGREYWVHLGSVNDGEYYAIASLSPEAMVQEVSVQELLNQFDQQGFLRLDVHFDTAKATIRPDSAPTLDQAAAMLQQAANVHVEVGGHTDNVGNAEANLTLSQQRAESVRAALVERGVGAERLTAKGYGDRVPVADNDSDTGRAANRRVEIRKISAG